MSPTMAKEIDRQLEELKADNEQLKKDLEHARSYKHTIKMRNRNLQTENERLKAENLKHREDKMTMALKYNEVLNELNDENERLKRELKQTEAQDQVVIDGLREENERLKANLESQDHISNEREMVDHSEEYCVVKSEPCYNPLKMFYEIAEKYFATSTPEDLENAIKEQRETNVIVHKDFIEHLREENAKLKCLALHSMRDLFDYKGHKLEFEGNKIWVKYCHKYNEFDKAYRKAKKALKEG